MYQYARYHRVFFCQGFLSYPSNAWRREKKTVSSFFLWNFCGFFLPLFPLWDTYTAVSPFNSSQPGRFSRGWIALLAVSLVPLVGLGERKMGLPYSKKYTKSENFGWLRKRTPRSWIAAVHGLPLIFIGHGEDTRRQGASPVGEMKLWACESFGVTTISR